MRSRILAYLKDCESEMFELLKSLVLQKSYTLDKTGVDLVGNLLHEALKPCDMTMEKVHQDDVGDHLIFRSKGCSTKIFPPILLVGHMDTVFPDEMQFNWYREEQDKVYGPGVIDMKGGLVTAIYALKALHHVGLLQEIPIIFICNSDEEKGSLTSKELLRREAKKSLLALVFECGGLNGEVVTGRKGKLGFHIEITGRAGHAASAGKNKASSIHELAYKIIAIEKLNNPKQQLVVNVGLVNGGIGPNTVAEKAYALVDCRFSTEGDGQHCLNQVKKIVADCTIAQTESTYTINSSRSIMEANEQNSKLFRLFSDQAKLLKLPLSEENRSGVSDANTLAGCKIAVLDGLGPLGEHDHSDREYMMKKSLPARTKLAAMSLLEIYQKQTTCEPFVKKLNS